MKEYSNIIIADDHQIFLDGLKLIFSDNNHYKIIGAAKNGLEVEALFNHMGNEIDIAILDVNMPKPNGFETCRMIKHNYPTCKVIILSMYNEEAFVKEFLNCGASAYVLKNAGKTELINAMEVALRGGEYISKELRKTGIGENTAKDNFVKAHSLTPREIEIIKLLSEERSSAEISEVLFISTYTVNTHRKNILRKLNIKNTAGLTKFAVENKLV